MAERITLDKPFGVDGEPTVESMSKVDQMLEILFENVNRLEDRLGATTEAEDSSIELTRWKKGPWTLDSLVPTDNIAVIRQDPAASTTYDDYAPEGIDKAVALELEPQGSGVVLTGIRQFQRQRRLLGLINRDSAESITVTHEDSGSTDRYRFDLPDGEDIEVGPKQALWCYYNIGSERWQLFITPHLSGGLSGGSTGISIATFDLSEAQLEAMTSAVGTEVVAAPGAGFRYVLAHCAFQTVHNTNYNNQPSYVAILTGGSVGAITTSTVNFQVGLTPRTSYVSGVAQNESFEETTFNPENKSITIRLSAQLSGSGSATAKGAVAYYTMPIA